MQLPDTPGSLLACPAMLKKHWIQWDRDGAYSSPRSEIHSASPGGASTCAVEQTGKLCRRDRHPIALHIWPDKPTALQFFVNRQAPWPSCQINFSVSRPRMIRSREFTSTSCRRSHAGRSHHHLHATPVGDGRWHGHSRRGRRARNNRLSNVDRRNNSFVERQKSRPIRAPCARHSTASA